MAARRLLLIMVLLLAGSTVLAALLPENTLNRRQAQTTTTPTAPTAPTTQTETGPPARTVRATLRVAPAGRARTIRARLGDQLALTVQSDRLVTVRVDGLGLVENAAPDADGRLQPALSRPGRFAILAGPVPDREAAGTGTASTNDRAPMQRRLATLVVGGE
jgi:hypothetical protein